MIESKGSSHTFAIHLIGYLIILNVGFYIGYNMERVPSGLMVAPGQASRERILVYTEVFTNR